MNVLTVVKTVQFNQYFSCSVQQTVICGTSISITVTVGLKRPNSNDGHQSVNSSGSTREPTEISVTVTVNSSC